LNEGEDGEEEKGDGLEEVDYSLFDVSVYNLSSFLFIKIYCKQLTFIFYLLSS
jgi:hypothetical protein